MVGWTVGRGSAAESLKVRHNGRLIRTVPVRGPRADIADRLGVPPDTPCVFHALLGLIGLGLEPTLSLAVALADGTEAPAGGGA